MTNQAQALRMEIAAHSVTRAKLREAETALEASRRTIEAQRQARIDPEMPILSAKAIEGLERVAGHRVDCVEAAGLMMLLDWQAKAVRKRPEIRHAFERRR